MRSGSREHPLVLISLQISISLHHFFPSFPPLRFLSHSSSCFFLPHRSLSFPSLPFTNVFNRRKMVMHCFTRFYIFWILQYLTFVICVHNFSCQSRLQCSSSHKSYYTIVRWMVIITVILHHLACIYSTQTTYEICFVLFLEKKMIVKHIEKNIVWLIDSDMIFLIDMVRWWT